MNLWPTRKLTEKQRSFLLQAKRNPLLEGKSKRKLTDFLPSFRAKRLLSLLYGKISLSQRAKYESLAAKAQGNFIQAFIGIFERRLDIALYRLNFAPSIQSARQLIRHHKVYVNRKIIDIASYLLQPGDVISLHSSVHQKVFGPLGQETQAHSVLQNYVKRDKGGVDRVNFIEVETEDAVSSMEEVADTAFAKQEGVNSEIDSVNYTHLFLRKKPLHFEVNYTIASAIFLYAPQLVWYPVPFNVSRLGSQSDGVFFQKRVFQQKGRSFQGENS